MMSHTAVLAIAYALVCSVWLLLAPRVPYWRSPHRPLFAHPWRELSAAALALVLVLRVLSAAVRSPCLRG